MDDAYDPLDRATLATWRASNALGWGAVALAIALVIHTMGDQLVRRVHIPNLFGINTRPQQFFAYTFWGILPQYLYRGFVAIVVGVAIGWLIGRKVWRSQPAISSAVAAAYVLITWLVIETSFRSIAQTTTPGGTAPTASYSYPVHGLPSGVREWGYSALGLIAIVVAPLVARFVAKRRQAKAASPGTP
jgi:hypothetical protein